MYVVYRYSLEIGDETDAARKEEQASTGASLSLSLFISVIFLDVTGVRQPIVDPAPARVSEARPRTTRG